MDGWELEAVPRTGSVGEKGGGNSIFGGDEIFIAAREILADLVISREREEMPRI